jgi:hypothetical protein
MIAKILRHLASLARNGPGHRRAFRHFARSAPENLAALRALRDQHKGRTAFIVATGPSIQKQNLAALSGQLVLSCSNLFLHPDIAAISPAFHFFAPYHPPLVEANWLDWLRRGAGTLPRSTGIVLGHSDQKRVAASRVLQGRDIVYLHLAHLRSPRADCMGPVPGPQSVPLMAIPFALHLGVSRIVLLGCDHTTFRDYGKTIRHFYPTEADPRINASGGAVWTGIEQELLANLNLFTQYRRYARLAAARGVAVENGSPDSWLEIFPRIDTRQEFGI